MRYLGFYLYFVLIYFIRGDIEFKLYNVKIVIVCFLEIIFNDFYRNVMLFDYIVGLFI